MNQLIYQIEQARSQGERLALLAELEAQLQSGPAGKAARHLKSLLYHPDWYIRQEIAFMIDRYGVPLKPEELPRFWFALQQFPRLKNEMAARPETRALLFEGCKDPAPRFRARLLAALTPADCRNAEERLLLLYAAGDYPALVEQGCEPEMREAALALLKSGLKEENNPEYHRKQCAFALEQLHALDNAAAAVQEILSGKAPHHAGQPPPDEETIAGLHLSPLEQFIRRLQRQGVRVDGEAVYPLIQQSPATGRITYRQPGLQTWPKEERQKRITPAPGCCWLRWDYRAMEPTLLLHFLLERFLISLEDLPEGDLYAAVDAQDRNAAKTWFNAVINGGGKTYHEQLNPWQIQLLDALRELRQELLQTVYAEGGVAAIAGNFLALSAEEPNLAGKAVNRLVQGSASDIFNHAVLQLQQRLDEKYPAARVGFLLFDEVWVEAPAELSGAVAALARETLLAVNDHFQLLCPLKIREEQAGQEKEEITNDKPQ